MEMTTLDKIVYLLESSKVPFERKTHEPTLTSEDSARVRGESLSSGAKAILYKVEESFYLFVFAANRKLNPKKIKYYFKEKGLKAKKSRFATKEELAEMTSLVPGSVPPFGRPILDFELFVDPSLIENTEISFNAGSLRTSIKMTLKDYLTLSQPSIFDFTE